MERKLSSYSYPYDIVLFLSTWSTVHCSCDFACVSPDDKASKYTSETENFILFYFFTIEHSLHDELK